MEFPEGKSPIIKGLVPGLQERGKIKIGRKGQLKTSSSGKKFRLPIKETFFHVTTLERGEDENFKEDDLIMKALGEKPNKIPIILIYDEIQLNFQCRYACYNGRTLFCSGDGEAAFRLQMDGNKKQIPCTCEKVDPNYKGKDKCKMNGVLNCMIQGAAGVGGVWKFRTTSYNSIIGILSSLTLIKRITNGKLAGIPLTLNLNPKTVVSPDGKTQTVYVTHVEFVGDMPKLRAEGLKIAKLEASHKIQTENVEQEALKLISMDATAGVAAKDVVPEFYPEAEEAEFENAENQKEEKPKEKKGAGRPTGSKNKSNKTEIKNSTSSNATRETPLDQTDDPPQMVVPGVADGENVSNDNDETNNGSQETGSDIGEDAENGPPANFFN